MVSIARFRRLECRPADGKRVGRAERKFVGPDAKVILGMDATVKARVRRSGTDGSGQIEIQRGKYKHWFQMGEHRETDAAFERALASGIVVWNPKIIDPGKIF